MKAKRVCVEVNASFCVGWALGNGKFAVANAEMPLESSIRDGDPENGWANSR